MKKDQYWTVIVPVVYHSFAKRTGVLPVQWPMLERYNIVPIPVFTTPIPGYLHGYWSGIFKVSSVPFRYWSFTVPFRYCSIVPSSKNRRSLLCCLQLIHLNFQLLTFYFSGIMAILFCGIVMSQYTHYNLSPGSDILSWTSINAVLSIVQFKVI